MQAVSIIVPSNPQPQHPRLTAEEGKVTSVDAVGESLGEKVVDPLKKVTKSEALRKRLAGHVVLSLVALRGGESSRDDGSHGGGRDGVLDLGDIRD